ncbi:MAG TPA: hypothetical protein PK159_16445 [Steroidobacteraceae bacterium]|nr:hypothetical protein [Steroidobacteraceae bacterium]
MISPVLALVTTTEIVWDTVPASPEQVNLKVEVSNKGLVVSVPVMGFVPCHSPSARQLAAFALLQLSKPAEPSTTLVLLDSNCKDGAAAVGATVGGASGGGSGACGGLNPTSTAPTPVPPAPVQLSVYVVLVDIGPTCALPEVDFTPVQPDPAVQLVALLALHVSVVVSPAPIVDGLAAMVIVGADTGGGADAGGVTLTAADAVVDPPEPVQTNI